ncbi:hypothetical protein GLYMA_14G149132v4 [Glycine max]|nr:hypothetical protein GLYMA_14G149132v4 [Glycine max]KAH1094554.1 hypothetical protein GYH30_040019 [Glycine max]
MVSSFLICFMAFATGGDGEEVLATGTPTPITSVPMNQYVPPSPLSMTNFSQQITEKLNNKNLLQIVTN